MAEPSAADRLSRQTAPHHLVTASCRHHRPLALHGARSTSVRPTCRQLRPTCTDPAAENSGTGGNRPTRPVCRTRLTHRYRIYTHRYRPDPPVGGWSAGGDWNQLRRRPGRSGGGMTELGVPAPCKPNSGWSRTQPAIVKPGRRDSRRYCLPADHRCLSHCV